MQDLVIIGAGLFGQEMAKTVRRLVAEEGAQWNLLGFIDEEAAGEIEGTKVLGKLEDFLKMDKSVQFFIADKDGYVRERIAKICKAAGFTGATIIDKIGVIAPSVEIGEGCYIGYLSFIMPAVKLGAFGIYERGTVIGHDTEVGPYSTFRMYASLGGDSAIGAHTTLGLRCTLINMVNIPDNCEFAAGSCVIKNTPQSGYYAGVPAKLIRPYEG